MNSQELLQEVMQHMGYVDHLLADLASRSEFQNKRHNYLDYQTQIQQIRDQLGNDLDNIDDYENFTTVLDKM
ncbi:hypothetical protein [Syntrophomonas erecta]